MAQRSNPHKGRTGLDRMKHGAGHSAEGLRAAYRHESVFRQDTWLAIVMLPLAFWRERHSVEVALRAGSAGLVLIVGRLSSAIEATVDRVSLDLHEFAKRAKDFGSAAVLLTLLMAGGDWFAALRNRFA